MNNIITYSLGLSYKPSIEIEYKCHWPNCQFRTKERAQIEFHHIVPQELGPRLNSNVTLTFCPTHHRMIYYPGSKHGHHSIKADNKLIIHHIYPCAPSGYAVEYENMQGKIWTEIFEGNYNVQNCVE